MTAATPPGPPSREQRRASLALFATTVVVLLALVVDIVTAPGPPRPAEPVAQDTAQAGAWYCPATAGEGESAVLTVAAVGEQPSRITVVRYPERRPTPDPAVEVAPGGEHALVLGPGEATTPVAVRWEGGPATASWRIESGDTPGAPCEPGPAETWHLAGLDTAGGSRSTLHLFNPFGVDAVARITFATPEGRVVLLLTDNVLVEANSTARIDLGQFQPEQPDLGATVEVLTGRLVAQGELVLEPVGERPGPSGRALVPAATAARDDWAFGYARVDETSSSWVSIMNPGAREAAVEIRVSAPTPEAAMQEYSVPAGGVIAVDLAQLSEEPEFGVAAFSVNEVPVVVHRVTTLRAAGREGLAVSRGAQPSARWALVGAGAGERRGRVTVYNPGGEELTVDVVTNAEGPPEWRGAAIPPNGWLSFNLVDAAPEQGEIPAGVVASGPVVAELRSHHQSGGLRLWSAVGIPAEVWAGPATRPPVRRDPALSTRPLDRGAPGPAAPERPAPGELPDVPDPDAPPAGEGAPPGEAPPDAEPAPAG
ncbi:MAG TPA: DUF5719 family protein [Egibacteraceae bacterium]|nr:DUF5719 family protein [Egibacteraceae bacterium]